MAFLFALSIWFWIGIIISIGLLAWATEAESLPAFIGIGAVCFIGYCLYSGYNPIPWLYANVGLVLSYLIGYVVVGIAWSFFKMDRHAAEKANLYKNSSASKTTIENARPTYTNSINKITNWIVGWPFSIIGFIIGDGFRYIIQDVIIYHLASIYDSISMRHFKSILTDEKKQS